MSKNWAICIGINRYYNLQPLKFAVQDASSVREFFLNEVGFEQVYYFSDDAPPLETPRGEMRSLPTYANLKRFFREWFQAEQLNVGDNFWFFFAGHGEIHEDHDYLLPIDVDPGNIAGTARPDHHLLMQPHRSSYEIEDLQHGSFTYALLEGLRLQGTNNSATVEWAGVGGFSGRWECDHSNRPDCSMAVQAKRDLA